MTYNIAINIKLKNNSNVSGNENLIYDIANNLNSKDIYYDYELEGVNKYIKKNNKIMIIEFENNNDFNELNILNNIDLNDSEELEKYFCSDLDYSSFEDIESNECKYNVDVNSKISFKDYKNKNKNI